MMHRNKGSIMRLRPWLVPVVVLSLGTLYVSANLRARGQCDLEADDIKPLIRVIRDKELQKKDPDRVRQAILQLGERRCAAAADDLAALLTFKYRFDWEGTMIRLQPIFTGTRFPATSALEEIGEASLPALVRIIGENPPNSLMTRNAVYTVKSIFRDHPDRAETYLANAAEKASTPQSQSRLKQAAAAVPGISLMDLKRYNKSASH